MSPSRRSRRIAAVLVLVVTAGVLAAATVRAVGESQRRARFRPPFPVGGAEAVGTDGVWRIDGRLSGPAVVVYVAWDCPHSRAELARWAEVLGAGSVPPEVDVRVVASAEPPNRPVVFDRLRDRVVRDREGSVARALGVEAVPHAAYIAPGGVVVEVARGRTSRGEIRRRLARLVDGAWEP